MFMHNVTSPFRHERKKLHGYFHQTPYVGVDSKKCILIYTYVCVHACMHVSTHAHTHVEIYI